MAWRIQICINLFVLIGGAVGMDSPSDLKFEFKSGVIPSTAASCPPLAEGDVDVTLVSQTSIERLWMVKSICERWTGPFVLVVYGGGDNFDEQMHDIGVRHSGCVDKQPPAGWAINTCQGQHDAGNCEQAWFRDNAEGYCEKTCGKCTGGAGNTSLHCATVVPITAADPDEDYPINYLRNIGLGRVRTSHYLMNDIDFWPSSGLYATLTGKKVFGQSTTSAVVKELSKNSMAAFVVPALQVIQNCGSREGCRRNNEHNMPSKWVELKNCIRSRKCGPFDLQNPGGHETTGYNKWINAQKMEVREIGCLKSIRYEPYVVLRKCPGTPLYDEAFVGYGKNKIQLIAHLRYVGFRFYVTPHQYLLHFPHPPSEMKKIWKNKGGGGMRHTNDELYKSFRQFLVSHYSSELIKFQHCDSRKNPTHPEPVHEVPVSLIWKDRRPSTKHAVFRGHHHFVRPRAPPVHTSPQPSKPPETTPSSRISGHRQRRPSVLQRPLSRTKREEKSSDRGGKRRAEEAEAAVEQSEAAVEGNIEYRRARGTGDTGDGAGMRARVQAGKSVQYSDLILYGAITSTGVVLVIVAAVLILARMVSQRK